MIAAGAGPGPWTDSHCHLQDRFVREGRPNATTGEALSRAAAAGVRRLVCVGTDEPSSRQALAIAREVREGVFGPSAPEVWASAGLHPHQATEDTDWIGEMVVRSKDEDGTSLAIGECGLDYHYEHAPRDAQRRAFAVQIALAHDHSRTLVIHARDAWDDLFAVLDTEGVPSRTVLHCFTGGPEEVSRCLEAGMYVSFSGILTFKNARDVREAAARCPLDRLLVETDSPFLAPAPHRGRPNEPANVPLVGAALAEVKGVTPGELAEVTTATCQSAFGVPSGATSLDDTA